MSEAQHRAAWFAFGFLLSATCGLTSAGPMDCNQNLVPDASDLLSPDFGDCNNNGVLDICDVDPADPDGNGLVSIDRNDNQRPDECDLGGQLIGPGVKINPRTGHATKMPRLPGVAPADDPKWIAFAPDGTLYGLRDRRLYTIDRVNWTTTDVATLNETIASPVFAPDGTLYALRTNQYGALTRDLVTSNLQTGAVTLMGTITGLPSIAAMAFAPDGTLHALDGEFYHDYGQIVPIPLYSIDLVTLAAVPVQYFPSADWGTWNDGLAFNSEGVPHISTTNYYTELGFNSYSLITGFIAPFPLWSLAFGPDDLFYSVSMKGLYDVRGREALVSRVNTDDYAASGSKLYSAGTEFNRIDVDTGRVTPLGGFTPGYTNPIAYELTYCGQQAVMIIVEDGFQLFATGGLYFGASGILQTALVCIDGQVFGVSRGGGQVRLFEFIDKGTYFNEVKATVVSTTGNITNLALGPNGIVYAVNGYGLGTIDLATGVISPIGSLGMEVTNVAYVSARVDPRDAAICVDGPDIETIAECTIYDFNGDGRVDLHDLSGLWLIDQR